MQLIKIHGNTYYMDGPTNIGVFVFKDKYTLLIDTGNHKYHAKKISEVLQKGGMNIKYLFNTHHHYDHSGGNLFLKENYPGSILYASESEKLFIEHEELFPMYLYGAYPVKELARHFVHVKSVTVDVVLTAGVCKIHDEKFEIIPLPGHTKGQVGIGTKDRVCFLGDGLFSQENIKKYAFPFLQDIEEQFHTYEVIGELDYDYYILGHSDKIYGSANIKELIKINKSNLNKYVDLALELLQQPKTKEDLLEEIAILEELDMGFNEYHFYLSATAAILAYLYAQKQLNYQIENGKLYYYRS